MRLNFGRNLIVTATDQWLAYLTAGKAFSFGTTLAAGVGLYSHIQLWNPVGSGKTCLVRSIVYDPATGTNLRTTFDNVARATDVGPGVNMLSAVTAAVCHVRTENNAAVQGTVWNEVGILGLTAYASPNQWVCILTPGLGLNIVPFSVNNSLTADFQWAEY